MLRLLALHVLRLLGLIFAFLSSVAGIVLIILVQVLLHSLKLSIILLEAAVIPKVIIHRELVVDQDIFHINIHTHLIHLILIRLKRLPIRFDILDLLQLIPEPDLILLYLVLHIQKMLIKLIVSLVGAIVTLLQYLDLFLDVISVLTILLLGPCWPHLRILLLSLPIRCYFLQCQLLLLVLWPLFWKWSKFQLLLTWFAVNRSLSIMDLLLGDDWKHLLLHGIIDSNRCCIWKLS